MNLFFLSRKRFLILFLLGFSALNQGLFAQDLPTSPPIGEIGHSIKVIYPGHAGAQIILGHYYDYMVLGKEQNTFDEKSTVEFSSPSPLPGGVYTFVVDGQVVQGDFIVDKDQDFIIYLNDDLTNGSVFQEFHGSPENDQLLAYQKFMMEQGEQIYHYHQLLGVSTDPEESISYYKTLDEIDDRIRAYRDQVSADAPSSVLGMVLSALPEPKLPEELRNPQNKADSLAAREFMSDHFWDDTQFWDGRLANTPFISDKLDRYFAEVLIPESDRVIKSIDKILGNAVADSMFYRLILKKVLLGSKAHFFKWDDAVFIHLYENYFATESHDWMSIDDRNDIDKHAFFLMGNTSGAQAPEITLQGLNDKSNKLSELESEYTILAFWDPTCAHCKVVLPQLDSIYQAKWKAKGIEVFAVGVESDATENEWRSIISEKELSDWTHVYCSRASLMSMAEAGEELLTKQYDVWYFPAFFLLDKDKRFMARKLSFKKMSEFVESIISKE